MKDDSFQDENISSINDDSLDWAKQAYLQLKQKQKDEKAIREKEIKEKEISNKKNIEINIKNSVNDGLKSNISVEKTLQVSQDSKEEDEPQLGDFDDTFTWSAEVLAAQGKKIDQFSLDDIDWLSRL